MAESRIDPQAVQAVLGEFQDPESGRSLLKTNQARDVQIEGSRVSLQLALTSHSAAIKEHVRQQLEERLLSQVPGVTEAVITVVEHDRPPTQIGDLNLKAKTVLIVGSGKGGVGKSTVAASLAWGLKRAGSRVGLLDADMYGPSIPHLFGLTEAPQPTENNTMNPVMCEGMPVMSIGFLVPPEQAMIWRGPILHRNLVGFLQSVEWGELDYLVIDMPPGTGDVALTLSQTLQRTGAVVVCTPQEVALLDAVKAVSMFNTVQIPVLGMVENMSGFLCPDCGKTYDIFGSGGARRKAEELKVPFLGEVPITMSIRENGDSGRTIHNFDDPQVASYFDKIVFQLVKVLYDKARNAPQMPTLPVL
ncbi:Mrp/NBP35 family ATP-binding protein [Lignipirellula cremea]|uniref:Iron-sulfur cluster carrier protein n=1 Tax=Lignipirellula cremea TaxID=2528010 RepID=A0A518E387_9BACT|nr:Mrp/NBP35 family ATP-binding protein [Lignipirellula cremea]QDU98532.1 Flagellum site-determining protein YlxH [Lignipirellula cremea]